MTFCHTITHFATQTCHGSQAKQNKTISIRLKQTFDQSFEYELT